MPSRMAKWRVPSGVENVKVSVALRFAGGCKLGEAQSGWERGRKMGFVSGRQRWILDSGRLGGRRRVRSVLGGRRWLSAQGGRGEFSALGGRRRVLSVLGGRGWLSAQGGRGEFSALGGWAAEEGFLVLGGWRAAPGGGGRVLAEGALDSGRQSGGCEGYRRVVAVDAERTRGAADDSAARPH